MIDDVKGINSYQMLKERVGKKKNQVMTALVPWICLQAEHLKKKNNLLLPNNF